MAKPAFTRTVNPLQFEALEPKRFEDLVRQLLYDFRVWRQLEPTGRMGSDDGFDIRAWEVAEGAIADAISDEEEQDAVLGAGDRIWLVQCKREKQIGPTKLLGCLNSIAEEDVSSLHGIIFAACTDFSKRARDDFREWCAGHGVREFYLWGKAELEDALFQAKNDGLLFAYFGLSLTIRRRSEQARLRARTTIKRKLKRAIEGKYEVLIRDVADENYPYVEPDDDSFAWWVFAQPKLTYRGLECRARRYFAYIDEEGQRWDYANAYDDSQNSEHADPWRGQNFAGELRQELFTFWDALPPENKAWVDVSGVMPFDRVLEVDEVGDNLTQHPHIFVAACSGLFRPFERFFGALSHAETWHGPGMEPDPSSRIEKFPSKFRKPTRAEVAGDASGQ